MNAASRNQAKTPSKLWEIWVDPRVVFSPDSKMLTMNRWQKAIAVYELASGKERLLLRGHEEGTVWLAFSRDGRTLASASWDETIRLWDLETGRQLRSLVGHRGKPNSVVFTKDGKTLISAGDDSTILFWDVAAQTHRPPLSSQPVSTKQLAQWWADLAGDDVVQAYHVIIELVSRSTQVVPWLKERLNREQSMESKQVSELIGDLDSQSYSQREKATTELLRLGAVIGPVLNKKLTEKPSPEVRQRIEGILPKLEVNRSPDRLRKIRALEVLEKIGTQQAREVVEELSLGDSKAPLTIDASDALLRWNR